jgi:tellurite resistance protein
MFRTVRRLPLFKLIAVVKVALLARRHLGALTPAERRRMAQLARHGHHLTREERAELRALASKLEPRAFAASAADHLAPFPVPTRLLRGRPQR